MIWSDYLAAGIIILMALRVAFKGFVAEFSSKSGIIVGAIFSFMFHAPFSTFFASRFSLDPRIAQLCSLAALFIIGYISARYLLAVLDELFTVLHLRVFDHILGLGLGAAEGAAICAVVIYALSAQTVVDLSGVYEVSSIVQRLYPVLPDLITIVSGAIE